nr:hypothetical protein BaRGS_034413 [Batillaria attramentaria]
MSEGGSGPMLEPQPPMSAMSSSPSDRQTSSLGLVQFGFDAKTSHDADEALLQTRSENFKLRPRPADRDIWKRPPPDFRYAVYNPRPPKRNTVDSQQPWLYGTIPGQREKVTREKGSLMPLIFKQRSSSPPPIVTRFHIARPFTAKKQFVREVKKDLERLSDVVNVYPPIKTLGLDEFETSYEKDPYNINFKTERLDIIHGLNRGPAEKDRSGGRQMAPPLSAKLKWDPQLILEKNPFPQRYEGFTKDKREKRFIGFLENVSWQM